MENVGIFYSLFDSLLSIGRFCVHLVHIPHLGMLYQEKSSNPEIYFHDSKKSAELCTYVCLVPNFFSVFSIFSRTCF
jgi:hypothetical protein